MSRVQAMRRDVFPVETLRFFYLEIIKRQWTKQFFNDRVDAVINMKAYGKDSLTWYDFQEGDRLYGELEIKKIIEQRLKTAKAKAKEYQEADPTTLPLEIQLYFQEELNKQCQRELSEKMSELQEAYREQLRTEIRAKKKQIQKLPLQGKLSLIELLKTKGSVVVGTEVEYSIVLKYLEQFAHLITDEELNIIKTKGENSNVHQ